MISSSLSTFKHDLNKAYSLIKPKRAAMEAFKNNLVHLLNQLDENENEENTKMYVQNLLANTFFDPDYSEPENISPVCYAHIGGFRDGFNDPELPEKKTLFNSSQTFNEKTLINKDNTSLVIKGAIHIIRVYIKQIVIAKLINLPTDTTALNKQIDELVYSLYELTPSEISMIEGK